MITYCGLSRSNCDAYLATQKDNDDKKADTARKWPEMYKADINLSKSIAMGINQMD